VLRGAEERLRIPASSDFPRLVRIDVDGPRVGFSFDEGPVQRRRLGGDVLSVTLAASDRPAEISSVEITFGWEELFEDLGGRQAFAGPAWTSKGPDFLSYELVLNVRLEGVRLEGVRLEGEGAYTFAPALVNGEGPWLVLEKREGAWILETAGQNFPFPAGFDPHRDQQLRVRKAGGEATIAWENVPLGVLAVPSGPSRPGWGAQRGAASFEAVRLIVI
jgi:hypothetical protein